MLITLFFFVVGSVIGALHAPWWESLPETDAISLVSTFGAGGAFIATLGMASAMTAISILVERRRYGRLLVAREPALRGLARVVRGPWPIVAGAVGLAVVNFVTFALAGRPWGITSAFALWGSKALGVAGVDVGSWEYWSTPARRAALEASLVYDVTSVMNVGILIGALAAAGLAGKFAPSWHIPRKSLAAAIVGGILLGYGARVAYGCNIGAYFSGVASGSLHGWLWLLAALAGTNVGIRLRPFFGLKVEHTKTC